MEQIISVIASLFFIIFASAILKKFKYIGDWSNVLNEYTTKFGLPVLIFLVLSKASFSLKTEGFLILINSLFIITIFLLVFIVGNLLKISKQNLSTLLICVIFGNVAYLGLPLIEEIYGKESLSKVSLIIAIYLFWIFSFGIGYLDYAKSQNTEHIIRDMLKSLSKNTLLIAVVLGLIFGNLQIPIPEIIQKSLSMISASVTPVVLIIVGIFIGTSKVGRIKEWVPVFMFSVTSLFVLPAILYFALKAFGYSPQNYGISILEAAMPLAITPFAIADTYNLNKKFIARTIVLSTILSVISLPFWVYLLK